MNSRVQGFLNHPKELLPDLLSQNTPYLSYARLKTASPHSAAFLQALFPTMIEQHFQGRQSSVILLSKQAEKPLHEEIAAFDKTQGLNPDSSEFSPALEPDITNFLKHKPQRLQFEAIFSSPQNTDNCFIVVHVTFNNGNEEIYESAELSLFRTGSSETNAFTAVSLPKDLSEIAHVKAYIWNPDRKEIYVHTLKLSYYK
jgi:hypothetical protein